MCAVTIAFALSCATALTSAHADPPVGFTTSLVLGDLDAGIGGVPTSFAYAPDGRIFVGRKAGVVDVYDGGVQHVFIDLSAEVNSAQGRGLLGLALDPRFATNRRVYIMFTQELDPANPDSDGPAGGEIVRYTADSRHPDVAYLPSRVTLLSGYNSSDPQHADGALRFDAKGHLLASWGDGTSDSVGDGQALAAQNLDDLRGKIIRIDRHTGAGVPGNPFYDAADPSSVRSKVFAYGFRNAYRFSIDPDNGTVYVGDVGWATWEELDKFPLHAPDPLYDRNGGWPCYEGGDGVALPQPKYESDPATAAACNALYTPEQGGTGIGTAAPLYAYRHDEVPGNVPSAITVGPKYDGTSNYPAQYDGQIFVADYGRDIFRTVDPVTGVATDFGTAGSFGNPVDIQIAPDGNVAYLGIGTSELREIVYTGPDQVPVVQAAADVTSAKTAPVTVNFSSAGTFDPDPGDTLAYSWDFGDGSPASTDANPSHTYEAIGSFHATLTVSDGHPGGVAETGIWIDVGNTPPVVMINAPDPSATYSIGDLIKVAVAGHDKQDGRLPPDAFTTQVIAVVGGQAHYEHGFTGAHGHFVAADFGNDDTTYEIVATATDSFGRSATATLDLTPAKVPVTIAALPIPATVIVDGSDTTTPTIDSSIIGGAHAAYAPATITDGILTFDFQYWTDGVTNSPDQYFTWTTPALGAIYTAVYAPALT